MSFLNGLGIWGYLAIALAAAAAGGTAAWEIKAGLDAGSLAAETKKFDDCRLARETDRANANAATVKGISDSVAAALAANEASEAAARAREARFASFVEKLNALPKTNFCARSPAMRLLFDSVRAETAAGDSNPARLPGPSGHDVPRQPTAPGR